LTIDLTKLEDYSIKELQEEILKLEDILSQDRDLIQRYPKRWLAVKLFEDDSEVMRRIEKSPLAEEILSQRERSTQHLQVIFNDTLAAVIADRRYGFISGACSEATRPPF